MQAIDLKHEHNDWYCPNYDDAVMPDNMGNCSLCGARLRPQKEKEFIQCGSCEQFSAMPKDGECPKCGSGNWVWGTID